MGASFGDIVRGAADLARLVGAVYDAVKPIATDMVNAALQGRDALDAVAAKRVGDYLGDESRLEIAMAAEDARRGYDASGHAPR